MCVRARGQSWGVVLLLPLQVLGVLLRSSDLCGESFTSRAALLVLHLNFSHLVELTLLSVSFVTQSTETHTKYVLEGSFYLKHNLTLMKTGFSWDVVAKKEI